MGSTRIKIYDNMIAHAQKDSRLPFQAQAVYDEILAKMKSVLRESKLTEQTRIEMEFNQLEMGRLPHSAFLTEWERILIAMDDAEAALPDAHVVHEVPPEVGAGASADLALAHLGAGRRAAQEAANMARVRRVCRPGA